MLNIESAKSVIRQSALLPRDVEKVLINQGRLLSDSVKNQSFDDLSDAGFQIFSQWGEDGIIQYILSKLKGTVNRSFVEFGVETFQEANCRFLMIKDNWSGLVIDGSSGNINKIKADRSYWRSRLSAVESFITKENIASIISDAGFSDAGILSVDIDGNDYFVLNALSELRPSLIIVEYNGLFGYSDAVTVPYDPAFVRSEKHHSNLYWGASIGAFDDLLSGWGYALVGVNDVGSNAFFVREDQIDSGLRRISPQSVSREVSFREARDAQGRLLFLDNTQSLALIEHMPVLDIREHREKPLREVRTQLVR